LVTQPPEGPPICADLKRFFSRMPPPILKRISPRGFPMGTSMMPVLTTSPARAKTLVPRLFSVPNEAYQSPPRARISGMAARVSTLLMMVGSLKRPDWKGKGGFCRGSPRWPSTEAMRAVSSPQTNAPAPMRTSRSKEKSVPNRFSPSSPRLLASSMALESRSTAMGYSART